MSNTTPPPAHAAGSHDESRFTVEDAGTTTDAGDLTPGSTTDGRDRVVEPADRDVRTEDEDVRGDDRGFRTQDEGVRTEGDGSPAPETEGRESLASLADDGSIAHVFDQTNGVIEGLEGDSDGTAAGDDLSAADREDENPAFDSFSGSEAGGDAQDESRVTGN